MPRAKELKINASELDCYNQLIAELQKNPLLADYDLSTIELKVKHIKSNNLLRYQSANRERIPTLDGVQLITISSYWHGC